MVFEKLYQEALEKLIFIESLMTGQATYSVKNNMLPGGHTPQSISP
jgi:hypothetical protein